MAKKAYLVVRAVMDDEAERPAFDNWYETDHVVFARRAFACEKAWRFWSRSDASVHYAVYRFADMPTLEASLATPEAAETIVDFDRVWPKVKRSREILEGAQILG